MITYNISMNEELAELIDKKMKEFKFANRSEFFRDLVRKHYLNQEDSIEEIQINDPDYKVFQDRKNDELVPLEDFLKQNNIDLDV